MKRIRHSPEQIIRKPREADAELARGVAIPEVGKALGVADETALTAPLVTRLHFISSGHRILPVTPSLGSSTRIPAGLESR